MSGVVKAVKKVFRKVIKVVKKIIKPVAIAVAVYFTAGLALAAFAPTAAFAASMPGFAGGGLLGTGIGAGATAGTGIFTSAANVLGLGGGLAKGAASIASKTLAIPGITTTMPSVFNTAAGNAAVSGAGASGVSAGVAAGLSKSAPALIPEVGMSLTDKLLLAKIGTDVTGALFGPTPQEEYEAKARAEKTFVGSFYGQTAADAAAPPVVQAPETKPPVGPDQNKLMAGREMRDLFPTTNQQPVVDPNSFGAMLPGRFA